MLNASIARSQDIVEYVPTYEIAVCVICKYALNKPPGIRKHLQSVHHWSPNDARQVDQMFVEKAIRSPSDHETPWIYPNPEDPPVPFLSLNSHGFGCHACEYVCIAKRTMINHYCSHHRQEFEGSAVQLMRKHIHVQQFVTVGKSTFFEVNRGNTNDITVSIPTIGENASTIRDKLHVQMQKQKSTVADNLSIIQKARDRREISPWLERTRWISHLEGHDMIKLVQLIAVPKTSRGCHVGLISIITSVNRVLINTRTMVTEDKILGDFDLKQINSFERHKQYSRPINLDITPETLKFYIGTWQRLLCYLIRTSRPRDGEDPPPVLYQLTQTERDRLSAVMSIAEKMSGMPASDVAYKGAQKNLDRSIVSLSISLLDHHLSGNEFDSVIVSFLAVAAIDPNRRVFKDVQVCTQSLSAIIKVAQLFVIRQSIDDVEKGKCDYLGDSLDEMRLRFMVCDARTPMAWVHSVRSYGFKLTEGRTVDGDITWSADYKKISYKGFETTIDNFRGFVMALLTKCRTQVSELFMIQKGESLSSVVPHVRLCAIKDVPSESRAGYSFIDHPDNFHLVGGSTWMIDRITGNQRLFERFLDEKNNEVSWRARPLNDYLCSISSFLETLWVLVHITSGQPARAPELLSARYCNTLQGEYRNLFIEGGLVSIVTTYHKSYSLQGTVKIIHRFLPKEVSEIMVQYIWLILPFKQFLESMKSQRGWIPSPLIWSECKTSGRGKKKWDGTRVCAALARESEEILKSKLGIQIYRHVAIAMSRKHIRTHHFTPVQTDEDSTWDEQTGHGSDAGGRIYARELRDVPGVVESKREMFRKISLLWHLFLGFMTWTTSMQDPSPFFRVGEELIREDD